MLERDIGKYLHGNITKESVLRVLGFMEEVEIDGKEGDLRVISEGWNAGMESLRERLDNNMLGPEMVREIRMMSINCGYFTGNLIRFLRFTGVEREHVKRASVALGINVRGRSETNSGFPGPGDNFRLDYNEFFLLMTASHAVMASENDV